MPVRFSHSSLIYLKVSVSASIRATDSCISNASCVFFCQSLLILGVLVAGGYRLTGEKVKLYPFWHCVAPIRFSLSYTVLCIGQGGGVGSECEKSLDYRFYRWVEGDREPCLYPIGFNRL